MKVEGRASGQERTFKESNKVHREMCFAGANSVIGYSTVGQTNQNRSAYGMTEFTNFMSGLQISRSN
jgi:hypothetical protein